MTDNKTFEIKTRLKTIYESKKKELGLTQHKIAEALGFSTQGAVSHYMNPNSPQAISKETILKFATLLKVEATEIDPDISTEFTTIVSKISENSQSTGDSIKLELLDNKLAAGDGIINLDYPDTIRSIEFSRDKFVEIFQRKTAKNLSLAIIDGNSMYDPNNEEMSLKHGDIVFIDTSIQEFKNDGIYAFVFEEKARIKRLQSMSGYRLKVISDNPTYETEILEKEQVEQIHFIGQLIKKMPMEMFDL
ncbi:LexA family transcriptional regulator [Rodentibacter genomosp. 2]|uniref:HTH cro/C1-type domain-containing protein n=1 Tax=Rodentibacter genomosp. 2 TaxID=1908266 RepID=A0A1V3JBC7_9PAST|nr:LexA family transcriptional regulator [Rodentibacter genomosp. 2]OOF53851.1 hypothetical protein BKK55_10625 [Rodentibacter genomosp. 2]